MNIRKIDAGLYVQVDEPTYHEYYCWTPDDHDDQQCQWYVLDAADDSQVAGPMTVDEAISESARRNAALGQTS